ncbi:MAG: RNA polymerase sigma factor [Opitutaceae bacterium]|nr:RNA polymerase sigma factor [Cytophagales bacterium]
MYTRYAPLLKSVCMRYIQDRDEAKDVLHDSFIKIFKVIGKYKGEGSFEGWLKRIVINVAIDHIKKSQQINYSKRDDFENLEIESDHIGSSSDQLLNSGFTPDDLLQIMQSVQVEYASVFNMFFIDQLSHKEIALALEIDENTSRTRLFRAKALVKTELEKELKRRQTAQLQ